MYGRAIVIAGVAAAALVGTTGLAGAGARADGVIVGCQKPGKGFLRVVQQASDCRRNERVVTWNERGPAGQAGPAGPAGAQGPPGPAGQARLARLARLDQRVIQARPARLARRGPPERRRSPRSTARRARVPMGPPVRSTSS